MLRFVIHYNGWVDALHEETHLPFPFLPHHGWHTHLPYVQPPVPPCPPFIQNGSAKIEDSNPREQGWRKACRFTWVKWWRREGGRWARDDEWVGGEQDMSLKGGRSGQGREEGVRKGIALEESVGSGRVASVALFSRLWKAEHKKGNMRCRWRQQRNAGRKGGWQHSCTHSNCLLKKIPIESFFPHIFLFCWKNVFEAYFCRSEILQSKVLINRQPVKCSLIHTLNSFLSSNLSLWMFFWKSCFSGNPPQLNRGERAVGTFSSPFFLLHSCTYLPILSLFSLAHSVLSPCTVPLLGSAFPSQEYESDSEIGHIIFLQNTHLSF